MDAKEFNLNGTGKARGTGHEKMLRSAFAISASTDRAPMMLQVGKFRVLRWIADGSIVYPLVVMGLLYGQWCLAWFVLGREPQWSNDDPKYIDGAGWMHPITEVVVFGTYLAAPLCVLSNCAYVAMARSSAPQVGLRLLTLVGTWLGLYAWILNNRKIVEWWLD